MKIENDQINSYENVEIGGECEFWWKKNAEIGGECEFWWRLCKINIF